MKKSSYILSRNIASLLFFRSDNHHPLNYKLLLIKYRGAQNKIHVSLIFDLLVTCLLNSMPSLSGEF